MAGGVCAPGGAGVSVVCAEAVTEDRWLSTVLGRAVFTVDAGHAAASLDELRRHIAARRRALYAAKIDTTRIDLVRMLGRLGFYVVDTNLTFARSLAAIPPAGDSGGAEVGAVRHDQHADVLAIAGAAFRHSRFHLDPAIPRVDADRIKREWVGSYVRGERGEALLTAAVGPKTAGFLALLGSEFDGAPSRTIDLIAVASDWRRRGVARSLVAACIARSHGDAGTLLVGTQAANLASVRLYESLGFRLAASRYVMHLHRG